MNGVVKNISALAIQTTGQVPSLSKGQKALLQIIRDCVEEKRLLTFDLIVNVYYENVRKKFSIGEGWYYAVPGDHRTGRYSVYQEYDILECWKKQDKLWYFRALIRQWFVSNIGILVIKNQLVIVPTIDLGNEDEPITETV